MRRRAYLTTLGIAAIAGCTGSTSSPSGDTATENRIHTPDVAAAPDTPQLHQHGDGMFSTRRNLIVAEASGYVDEYTSGVKGILENRTGETLSYVEVVVYFYDENDTRVGDGLDNTQNLRSSERWAFDAAYLGEAEWTAFQLIASDSPF